MQNEPGTVTAIASEEGSTRVLLITTAPDSLHDWPQPDGSRLDRVVVPNIRAAAARIDQLPFDVVVIDTATADANPTDLQELCARIGGAGLLVLSSDHTPDTAGAIRRVHGTACLLPSGAAPELQAEMIMLAADRARLETALAQRDADLERRTLELEQSRARFRDVIERNADAIVVLDREGIVRFANAMAAELFRTRREDLVGAPFGFPVVAGETTQLDLLHPDGARVVEMRVVESEWEGSTAYIATLRDATERQRAEESARQLIREQAARSAAETAARRFRFQAEASRALSATVDYAATLASLAGLCAGDIADWAEIFIVDEHGVKRAETAHCDPAHAGLVHELRDFPIAMDGTHPVLDVLRTRTPMLVSAADDADIARLTHDERHLELVRRLGIVSFLIVPLVARGRALGAIQLVSSNPERRFTDEDVAAARDLALRAALALDNARLYQQAQQANHAKADLLAVISHDLRTPLNAIIGYSELLSMGVPDALPDPALHQVERIDRSARHLLYLIDELSSFARLEAGRAEINVRDTGVDAVAQEVSAVMQPLAAERGLDFHLQLPDEPLSFRTDPDRLRQILLNLTGNAVKYTSHGSVTLAAAGTADGGVEFQVHDTGIGISEEHLERVFEPFWQVDPTQRAQNQGTGLGLSIVRQLVRMLGGDIAVHSVVGDGSTFTVRLPPAPAPVSGPTSHT